MNFAFYGELLLLSSDYKPSNFSFWRYLGTWIYIAGFALTASYFSFSSKRKVTKRMPSQSVCPDKKRSGCLNLQLLPTRTPRCAIRAHWAKFAVHGKFTLPTAANSANRKGSFTREKQKRYFRQAHHYFNKVRFLLLIFFTSAEPANQEHSQGFSVQNCLSPLWFIKWVSFLYGLIMLLIWWAPPVLSTGGD